MGSAGDVDGGSVNSTGLFKKKEENMTGGAPRRERDGVSPEYLH